MGYKHDKKKITMNKKFILFLNTLFLIMIVYSSLLLADNSSKEINSEIDIEYKQREIERRKQEERREEERLREEEQRRRDQKENRDDASILPLPGDWPPPNFN
jgi:hypothetical protein